MTDRDFMARAIELAGKGRGWTNPNPLVGAVIVKEGRIIGEGYHARYGELHAERNAIRSLRESARGATLYVTLEPCCHYGKTPPCTEAILEQGIRRVVIGSRDPNPLVAGKGAAMLREAGVEVSEDFMRAECDALNPVFFHYITTGRPYVVMKYAMTADGKIATKRGDSKWITGEEARKRVHRMRSEYMAVLAGIGTVLADDPMLNVRLNEVSPGRNEAEALPESERIREEGARTKTGASAPFRQPIRVICDSRLRLPLDSRICRTAGQYETLVACGLSPRELGACEKARRLMDLGIQVLPVPDGQGQVDLFWLMELLGKRGIDSLLIEGGGTLNDSALRAGIVKEIKAFVAPKLFGGREALSPVAGIGADRIDEAVKLRLTRMERIGEDLLLEYAVENQGLRKERRRAACLPES